MKSSPLVSIVTPSLDQGAFIEETILSMKMQSYPNIEHIIIDGGSSDGTLSVLARNTGTYNMRWFSQPDDGMYEAINKGFKLASGDILAYLNSDDMYLPWTVETIVDYFRRHPRVDIVYGDVLNLSWPDGILSFHLSVPFNLGFIRRVGLVCQPTAFWRRHVYEQMGGFDEGLKFVADCDFWMKAGGQYRIRKLDEFLAIERVHAEAKNTRQRDLLRAELAAVRRRYSDPHGRKRALWRWWDRAYEFLWRRILQGKLIWRRATRPAGQTSWERLLAVPGLRLSPPTHQLLLSLIPKTHRRARFVRVLSPSYEEIAGFADNR